MFLTTLIFNKMLSSIFMCIIQSAETNASVKITKIDKIRIDKYIHVCLDQVTLVCFFLATHTEIRSLH